MRAAPPPLLFLFLVNPARTAARIAVAAREEDMKTGAFQVLRFTTRNRCDPDIIYQQRPIDKQVSGNKIIEREGTKTIHPDLLEIDKQLHCC